MLDYGIQHARVIRFDGSGSVTITKFVYTEVLCWRDIIHTWFVVIK